MLYDSAGKWLLNVLKCDVNILQAMASWEDKKLVISYEPVEGDHPKPQKVIREIVDGELVMVNKNTNAVI